MRWLPTTTFLLLLSCCVCPLVSAEPPATDEAPATDPASAETNRADSASESSELIAAVGQSIVTQTNDFRVENGLEPVQVNDELEKAAEQFAKYMAETRRYGHNADGRTPAQRASAAGYDYCVVRENIAYRTNTGEVTNASLTEVFVQGWIDSPPHRENMLANYVTQTGVAVATSDSVTFYAVQLFGRPRSKAIELTVRNESDETKTLIVRSNDNRDDLEMPPRTVVKMTRCFPTTLTLQDNESGSGSGGEAEDGSNTENPINESATFVIQDDELQRDDAT